MPQVANTARSCSPVYRFRSRGSGFVTVTAECRIEAEGDRVPAAATAASQSAVASARKVRSVVLVAGQPPEHRLAQQAGQPVAAVLAGARVRKRFGTRVGQAQRSSSSR